MELDLNMVWPIAASALLAIILEKAPRKLTVGFHDLKPSQKQAVNQIMIGLFAVGYQLIQVCLPDGCAISTAWDVVTPLVELLATFLLSLGVNQGVYYGVKDKSPKSG